jgi:hypothetical protein
LNKKALKSWSADQKFDTDSVLPLNIVMLTHLSGLTNHHPTVVVELSMFNEKRKLSVGVQYV